MLCTDFPGRLWQVISIVRRSRQVFLYQHRAAVDKFLLVVQRLIVHVRGATEVP